MASMKDCVDLTVSWEIQDNKKLSSILHCEKVHEDNCHPRENSQSDESSTSIRTQETSGAPAHPEGDTGPASAESSIPQKREMSFNTLQLRPFLHPEMTRGGQCELRVLTPPRHHLCLVRLVVISSARNLEVYDRMGEYMATVKMDKLSSLHTSQENRDGSALATQTPPQQLGGGHTGSRKITRWYRGVYKPQTDLFEISVKLMGSSNPNQLLLRYIGVEIASHDWPEAGLSSVPLSVAPPGLDRVQELLLSALAAANAAGGEGQNAVTHQRTRASSVHSQSNSTSHMANNQAPVSTGSNRADSYRRSLDATNLRSWLETRLAALESNLLSRFNALETRLSQLESRLPPTPTEK